eukprot:m.169547 g.169547  ORF g.169547 m.169547 type:complete len:103 (-) comp14777_c0_seq8:2476-2784(-)
MVAWCSAANRTIQSPTTMTQGVGVLMLIVSAACGCLSTRLTLDGPRMDLFVPSLRYPCFRQPAIAVAVHSTTPRRSRITVAPSVCGWRENLGGNAVALCWQH